MSDIERKAFEKCSLIPSDAEFCDKHQMYQYKQYKGVIEHPINELWESFCDGSQWQINRPQFTALCHSKTKQIGSPVGFLVENEAGGLAAVHNLGRVTWLDDCVAGPVEQAASAQDSRELHRYGIEWDGPRNPIAVPMDDGYWTPWHVAVAECSRLQAQDGGELPARKDFEKEEFHGEFPEKEESLIRQDGSEPVPEVVSVYMGTDIIENCMLTVGTKLCICPPSAVAPHEPTRIMCEAGACVPLRDKQSEAQWVGEIFRAMMDAAPQQPSAVVPGGWKLVPGSVTEEMQRAFESAPWHEDTDLELNLSYQAMIAAAPQPPDQEQES